MPTTTRKRMRFSDGHSYCWPEGARLRGVRFALLRGESIYCPYCWRTARILTPVVLAERYKQLKRSQYPTPEDQKPPINWLLTRWPPGYEGWGIVRPGHTHPRAQGVGTKGPGVGDMLAVGEKDASFP